MKLLKSLFAKKELLSNDFDSNVEYAIKVITEREEFITDDELWKCLTDKEIAENERADIVIFVPIAFVRRLLPEITWPAHYVIYISERKQIRRRYDKTVSFLRINEVMEKYLKTAPGGDAITKIAGRSAEYGVINSLLKKGGKLTDIELTESFIVR
jgi:hypothetical protein